MIATGRPLHQHTGRPPPFLLPASLACSLATLGPAARPSAMASPAVAAQLRHTTRAAHIPTPALLHPGAPAMASVDRTRELHQTAWLPAADGKKLTRCCLHSTAAPVPPRESLPAVRGTGSSTRPIVTVGAAARQPVVSAAAPAETPLQERIPSESDQAPPSPAADTAKLERSYVVTADQLSESKSRMDKFIDGIESNPEKRDGAFPYYLLHKEGELVYGTALLFHGFASKPDQLWRLAQYLFDNGFNIYQPAISNHYLVNPDKNWPQVDLRLQWKSSIRQKFLQDPVLAATLSVVDSVTNVTQEQLDFLEGRIRALSPDMEAIVTAINQGDYSDSFDKYYDSSHLNYLSDAEARLAEVAPLPGPVFTVGLSVGGAVALGLAASQNDKVVRTVAYAPLLKEFNEVKRQFSLIAGPLDVKESGWDPKLQFTVGCFAATDVFGTYVRGQASRLAKVPTFLMLTENDDSADIPANKEFTANLVSLANETEVPHLEGMYFASQRVPHPMVDPTEVSQGMTNRYWASLYQETFRFLTQGTVDQDNLKNLGQDPALPQVSPVQ